VLFRSNERYQSAQDLIIDLKAVDLTESGFSRITTKTIQAKASPINSAVNSNSQYKIISMVSILLLMGLLIHYFFFANNYTPKTNYINLSITDSRSQQILRSDAQVLTISPDGETVVYCLNNDGATYLYQRAFNSFEIKLIEGTKNANAPFFSPDGEWIGFNADGKIKVVNLTSGGVSVIHDEVALRGASWGKNDRIVFSPSYGSSLYSISSLGKNRAIVTQLDSIREERTHRWPQVLPNGKHVIYTIGDINNPNSYENAGIAIQELETGKKHVLEINAEMARYIEPGYVIFSKNGSLFIAPFNLDTYTFSKKPISRSLTPQQH